MVTLIFFFLVSARPLLFPLALLESAKAFHRKSSLHWGLRANKSPEFWQESIPTIQSHCCFLSGGGRKGKTISCIAYSQKVFILNLFKQDVFQSSLPIKLYVNLEKSFLQKPDFLIVVAFDNSFADCVPEIKQRKTYLQSMLNLFFTILFL